MEEFFGLIFTITAMFGLIIGSFLNVAILRLPVMLQTEWQKEANLILDNPVTETSKFNLLTPNSRCPACQHKIRPWENIPLLSFLFLKGKCSNCKVAISPRYPMIEVFTAFLTCMAIYTFGLTPAGLGACLLSWVLLVLSMIDFDHKLLPDNLTLPFIWVGLIFNYFQTYVPLEEALWGAITGYLSLWTLFWAFKLFTGKDGMGYGDFKLLALLGAWMGWQQLPIIIILSSFSGALLGGTLILLGRDRADAIPFGPYLAIAGWLTFIWGDELSQLYWQLLG